MSVETLAARAKTRALEQQVLRLKGRVSELVGERNAAERAAEMRGLHAQCAREPAPVVAAKRSPPDRRTAAAVALLSDWHVGEKVTKAKTGCNTYNPKIAAASARALFEAIEWHIAHHRVSWQIDTLVLWLGGDLITGYLHDDQKLTNYLSPTQESLLAQQLIGEGLDRLLGVVDSIVCVCSYGNHGRTTIKPVISAGAENSFEWALYQQLARTYAKESRIRWEIASGEFAYLRVFDTTIRFTHGDAARFGGGVGGITIPINKALAKWQTYRRADVTCMGHFHSYHDLPELVVNGSLIGAAPYGIRFAAHERPAQAFFLVDSEKGKCMSNRIWIKGR
jgi:hypothetical protein